MLKYLPGFLSWAGFGLVGLIRPGNYAKWDYALHGPKGEDHGGGFCSVQDGENDRKGARETQGTHGEKVGFKSKRLYGSALLY